MGMGTKCEWLTNTINSIFISINTWLCTFDFYPFILGQKPKATVVKDTQNFFCYKAKKEKSK